MKFFLVVPPGLEDVAEWELRHWWNLIDGTPIAVERFKGGLEFEASVKALYLNKCLKTPSRILLRLSSFRLKSYDQLADHVVEMSFPFSGERTESEFSVSASRSKCGQRNLLEKTLKGVKRPRLGHLFVRVVNDLCTISIDTSGEHLHRRGYKKHVGKAPLRENLAAALILSELRREPLSKHYRWTWLDPMMGSGTFLSEAATLFQPVDTRRFSYQDWEWETEVSVSEVPFVMPEWSFFGADFDQSEVEAASANWPGSPEQVRFFQEDLFSEKSAIEVNPDEKLWLICNKPYGMRVKSARGKADQSGSQSEVAQMAKKFRPERISVLDKRKKAVEKIHGYKLQGVRQLENGGVAVSWLSYHRRDD